MTSAATDSSGYEGRYAQAFKLFLQRSTEHSSIFDFIDRTLLGEFTRIGDGKSTLNVLGLGSGGGEVDVHLLTKLQSVHLEKTITADIVEPSKELTQTFKALVAKTPNLKNIRFTWNTMTCAEYEQRVKETKDDKRFDFIHMIQMLYYVSDYAATIKFFHSLLREKGKLLIIHEAAGSGWELLWKTYKEALCTNKISQYLSAGDIKIHLENLGLKYEEHEIPNTLDITECFMKGNETGELLLDFMTEKNHFYKTTPPDLREGILELLRNKCSKEKDGRIIFNSNLSALFIQL
ncbi:histamine N-methyltransferase-like [Lepisosteus oculatus]|uniref:Histamine N-methyltransferase n=1 Tax=Lepisosteus oculatus TaxID=7918 RepID=W5LYB1_LEPOC|nr:PREDICTED: histamine N-methyltransferase-like [Lepisosteus oculatus]XP_015214054.1 PREDICTED: histamine N-methyltransferase-like [Lepisosteus oculatus]